VLLTRWWLEASSALPTRAASRLREGLESPGKLPNFGQFELCGSAWIAQLIAVNRQPLPGGPPMPPKTVVKKLAPPPRLAEKKIRRHEGEVLPRPGPVSPLALAPLMGAPGRVPGTPSTTLSVEAARDLVRLAERAVECARPHPKWFRPNRAHYSTTQPNLYPQQRRQCLCEARTCAKARHCRRLTPLLTIPNVGCILSHHAKRRRLLPRLDPAARPLRSRHRGAASRRRPVL
jgi:hypothetical protein